MQTLALGPSWLDPDYLLDTFGIWGLLLIVFAESGLLIGFFLPGDSLLFTAGLLITSDQLDFPLWAAIVLICVAAILGDQAGYMFGKKVGPALFKRPDSRLFKQENVTKAHEFFEKYGPKSLVLARFVPIVRTFTPIIAGVSGMRYRSFLIFNVVGGILWGAGVTLLGSWLGKIDFVKTNIEPILLLIVFLSVVPIIIEFLRARSQGKKNPSGPSDPAEAAQGPAMDDATTPLRLTELHDGQDHQQNHQRPSHPQGQGPGQPGYPQGPGYQQSPYPYGQGQGAEPNPYQQDQGYQQPSYPQGPGYQQSPYPYGQGQGQGQGAQPNPYQQDHGHQPNPYQQ
ncbi:DedA family protein [Streptomyces cavernae]|uniref:DedA family protein n=1 Tax=Streptomyces cavernae TaxID=2259034 RepID=UPI000FEBD214|nr:VTT domain-containing protein [Streptomyces cavernae]